ncbi:MAG: GGDEF domain-containing protein [Sulfurimonas sp.]|nr:GGDEF domain-containing protein [Sulfurimonas sp.]MBU3939697.1 GGDEF domain-containing protein [bacterium]MBU4024352.1 GGDEF domain-containing protein [bacterium]MBU4059954.1 GGDEF domain-containing protein [bacterium]MBU4111298.1 GGDEF domain-containing protein [bacterium]
MIELANRVLNFFLNIGSQETDSKSLRLQKSSLILLPLIIGPAAFIWGLLYYYLGHYVSASIPMSYSFISIYNLWHLHRTKNIVPFLKIQMFLVLFLPFFLMWSLGGFAAGSYVMIWAFFAPIAALIYKPTTRPLCWFCYFVTLVVVSTIMDPFLIQYTTPMPQIGIELFFLLNIAAGLSGVFYLFKYYIEENEKNANESLKIEHDALLEKSRELEEANLKLQDLAHHDPLTSLPNRIHLEQSLSKMFSLAKRNNQAVAILYIDLDGFKIINDNFGHDKGDEVLESVAKSLNSLLREEDSIARVGGDEFIVAINIGDDSSYAEKVAQRIIDKIGRSNENISDLPQLGASIGISLYPAHAEDIRALIKFADQAMYNIKLTSKNSFEVYDENMHTITQV